MNPIVFAMRRPVTIMMLVVAVISGGALSGRTPVEVAPTRDACPMILQ